MEPEVQSAKDEEEPIRQVDGEGNYIPNSISVASRLINIIITIALLIYGAQGIYTDDLYIPGKGGGTHYSGTSIWLVYAGIICLCMYLISIVIDHYDKRDNEHYYYKFGKSIRLIGFLFYLAAIVLH